MTESTPLLSRVQAVSAAAYDWPLPPERIARHPLAERDACRLLVAGGGREPLHTRFSELPEILEPGTLLVCNDTRVINARLLFRRPTGAAIEVFCLEPHRPAEYSQAFAAEGSCEWKCLVGRRKRWKEPTLSLTAEVDGAPLTLTASLASSATDSAESVVRFEWTPASTPWGRIVDTLGRIPIPPYLERDSEESDRTDYQTVYARPEGSVAAPTAGLHFTPQLMETVRAAGVETEYVTLHVGAGTFRPVKSADIGGHPMHSEAFAVSRHTVERLAAALAEGRHVAATGTTAVRTLESLYRLALQTFRSPLGPLAPVTQWEPYAEPGELTGAEAMTALAEYMDRNGLDTLRSSTSIIIAPGYRWRIVDRLITNFHQPQSTLLLLVSSFLGDTPGRPDPLWRRLYADALRLDYRFLSYGDAMLLDGGTSLYSNTQ